MKIGPCPECGEELAADQRYCVNCGSRVENSLAPSYLPVFGGSDGGAATRRGFPMPIPIAGTFAAVALAFGVVLGTAISPNVSGLVAGEHAGGPVVVQAPEPKPEPQKKGGGDNGGGSGGFGGSGFSGSSFGSGFYGSSGSGGSTTGTGGVPSDDKKKKPKPDYTYLSGTVVHQNPGRRQLLDQRRHRAQRDPHRRGPAGGRHQGQGPDPRARQRDLRRRGEATGAGHRHKREVLGRRHRQPRRPRGRAIPTSTRSPPAAPRCWCSPRIRPEPPPRPGSAP